MKDGIIQQVDTPLNLYNHPCNMFVAGFIGSPSMNFLRVKLVREEGRLWMLNPDFRLSPSPERREALTPHVGQEIVLGIRPEAIADDRANLDAHPEWVVAINVDVVEPMGSENYVHFTLNRENVIARVNADTPAKVLQKHQVVFDLNSACYFDADTQQIIHSKAQSLRSQMNEKV
jgi:multiple sugar transport system ATP-binding protein